jgi:hypothetical protein
LQTHYKRIIKAAPTLCKSSANAAQMQSDRYAIVAQSQREISANASQMHRKCITNALKRITDGLQTHCKSSAKPCKSSANVARLQSDRYTIVALS